MSKRIPQTFIDEVVARTDIVDLIGRRVALKRAGSVFKGLCPFHDEKTPSFIVTPARGTYHCFGCAAHGTAVSFLMNHDSLSFPEAIEALADTLGLSMPQREVATETDRETDALLKLLDAADQLFRASLRGNQRAIEYLRGRGIDGSTAARFGIGYAPDSWSTVLDTLGVDERAIARLLQAGLIRRNETGRRYDYFRDRIMFPIRDPRGRTIGFGARALGDAEPKYLNSPETPVFVKGKTLYGLYEARQAKGALHDVIVVEGYMDVVGLAQHGVGPALATLGTATTTEHVRHLTRLAERIVFCFDGDPAGRRAAWRALETILPFGGGKVAISFMLLPPGEDPDSLVRSRGAEAFLALKDEARSLSEFFIDELAQHNELGTADSRAQVLAQAEPLLEKLPPGVYRELLANELGHLVGIAPDRVLALLAAPTQAAKAPATAAPAPRAGQKSKLMRHAIALVLQYPSIAAKIEPVEDFDAVTIPGADLLRALLEAATAKPEITTAQLVERFREDSQGRYLPRLAVDTLLDDAESAPEVLRDSLIKLVAGERRRRAARAVKQRGPPADNPSV